MKLILIAALLAGSLRAEELQITLYDRVGLPEAVMAEVGHKLGRIFGEARVDVRIVEGNPEADEASLFLYSNLLGKEGHKEAACRARRDIALQILPSAPGLHRSILGMAQPLAAEGLNVRIYNDRVTAAAARANRSYSAVLAHVVAHEIGHVLLRDGAHMGRGLMSGVWTSNEYERMDHGFLFFTATQAESMRQNLQGSGCPDSLLSSGQGIGVRSRADKK